MTLRGAAGEAPFSKSILKKRNVEMKRWFFRLLLPGVFGVTAFGAESPVLLSQAIDFLDNAYFTERGDYYSKEELAERLRLARDAGIRKIYFRGTGGVAYYPSRVRRMFAGEQLGRLEPTRQEQVLAGMEAVLRPHLWDPEKSCWVADYVRLRLQALRED